MSASSSSSKPPPPHLHLHVDTTSAAAATATASSGSASSSESPHAPRPSGQNSACAACKYQRRRCSADCPLAPYFPADQQRRFLNAHRLFGVSNIQKTLRRIDPKYGPDAMRSLIYQSDARAADPVGGCVGIIEELRRQICDTEMELHFVRQQIDIYRQASTTDNHPAAASVVAGHGHGQQQQLHDMVAVDAIYAGQQPSIPAAAGGSGGLVFHSQQQDHRGLNEVQEHNNYFFYNNGITGGEATSDDAGGMGMYQQYGFADSSLIRAGSPVALGEQLGKHCQIDQPLPFVNASDVKPQLLPATVQQYHGLAAAGGDVLRHPEQKLVAIGDDVDEHMEERRSSRQRQGGAPCHLELGFSSNF